ncbi:GntR family transcriptional regulator [Clostridia bacterium]|nr:GntR family transcriptional regulator [Clostridia bacterium]
MFKFNLKGGKSVYEQVYEQIAGEIYGGGLQAGEQLPTIRTVAKDLGVNPNTVQKSYQMLELNKLIFSVPGKGSFVAEGSAGRSIMLQSAMDSFSDSAEKAFRFGATADKLHIAVDDTERKIRGKAVAAE